MKSRRDFMMSALALVTSAHAGVAKELGENTASTSTGGAGPTALPAKRDYRDQPFRVAVAFGASITAGGEATSPELDWVSLLAALINEAQFEPVKMHNNGIGANVISPRSSHYSDSFKPSAMERYQDHVIAYHPDLVLMAGDFGTNDARGGTPLSQFLEDERQIVLNIKKQTGALVVVTNVSFFTAFERYAPFNLADVATVIGFNCSLKEMAQECDALYADIFAAQDMAGWTVDPKDGVHLNNLGHRLAANRTFEVLAQNCSCLALKANALRKTMKEWRPTREIEIRKEFLEKHEQHGSGNHP
jgi:lysophospholipase L1-like esterase